MGNRSEGRILMTPTSGMTDEQMEVFNSLKNIRGLAEKITRILIAYAHEKGLEKVSISVLDGYATVSEAERERKGAD